MDQNNYERRGLFDGLTPPFDPNMLLLALACVVGFHWVVLFLEWFMDVDGLLLRIVTRAGIADLHPGELSPAHWVVTIAVALGFWSFFSVAISRIAAMKIAREETLGLAEASAFGLKKFAAALSSVGLTGGLIVVCYALVNATVFGWIGRIPYAGELIIAVLYPIVLLFTFFVVCAAVVGLFSFNMSSSAIATESSDSWDGLMRSWNYALVRPWTVLLVLGLTVAYITVFSLAGGRFMKWSIDSLAIGWWGMGDRVELVKLKGDDLEGDLRVRVYDEPTAEALKDDDLRKKWEDRKKALDEKDFWLAVPSKVQFLRGYTGGDFSWRRVEYGLAPTKDEVEALKERYDGFTGEIANPAPPTGLLAQLQLREDREAKGSNNVAFLVPWSMKLAGVAIWGWRWLCIYLMAAYALQYLLSANTMLYFLLRKEVEGEDFSEIVIDEDELAEEDAWSVAEPGGAAAGGAGAGGALLTPTLGVGGPPAKAPSAAPAASAAPAPAAPAPAAKPVDAVAPSVAAPAAGPSAGASAASGSAAAPSEPAPPPAAPPPAVPPSTPAGEGGPPA